MTAAELAGWARRLAADLDRYARGEMPVDLQPMLAGELQGLANALHDEAWHVLWDAQPATAQEPAHSSAQGKPDSLWDFLTGDDPCWDGFAARRTAEPWYGRFA